MRIEGRIEGPSAGATMLTAPFTGQDCVLYSASVSRQLHDGMRPASVAFASAAVDFTIVVRDAPHLRIFIRAEDVSLFDMHHGRRVMQRTFAEAPQKWQDFMLMHRAGTEWQTSSQLKEDSSCLEFEECALLNSTLATFVGELERSHDNTLRLRPLEVDVSTSQPQQSHQREDAQSKMPWRTSWECSGCANVADLDSPPLSPREVPEVETENKILVSDAPSLLEGATLADGAASVIRSVQALLLGLPAKCRGRAANLMAVHGGGQRART